MRGLVVEDYDEAGQEGEDGHEVEGEVDGCSGALVGGGVGGLEDEDGLG